MLSNSGKDQNVGSVHQDVAFSVGEVFHHSFHDDGFPRLYE